GTGRNSTWLGTTVPTETEKFTVVIGLTSTFSKAVVTRVFFCGSRDAEMRAFGSTPFLAAASRFGSFVCALRLTSFVLSFALALAGAVLLGSFDWVDFCAAGERVLFCSAFLDGSAVFALLVAALLAGFLFCSSACLGCDEDFSASVLFVLSAPALVVSLSAALALSAVVSLAWPVVSR